MNKNVKFLGAAAAALLTVAPIAAPVVSSVANTVSAADTDADKYVLHLTATDKTVEYTENPKDYMTNASFEVSTDKGAIVGTSKVTLAPTGGQAMGDKFIAGWAYNQTGLVSINGLEAGKKYTIAGSSDFYTANSQGVVTNVKVNRIISAIDSTKAGQPFFTYINGSGNNVSYFDGQVVALRNWAKPAESYSAEDGAIVPTAKDGLTEDFMKIVVADFMRVTGGLKGYLSPEISTPVQTSDIKTGFEGMDVKDGKVTSSNFYLTLTVNNAVNGKKATIKIPVRYNQVDKSGPVFTVAGNDGFIYNGGTAKKIVIKKGSKFNPTDNIKVTAHQTETNQSIIGLRLVSNTVNTKVPGMYTTKFSATNANGISSTITVPVEVRDTDYAIDTVNFKPGFGVNVWRLAGDKDATWTGQRALHGTEFRTWDTKTVNGIEYTRVTDSSVSKVEVAKTVNTWVQSQYLSANAGQNNNQNTNNGEETKLSGVVKVTYNGRGKVALWTKDHKISGQYVAKNTSWKVFASKTMGGKTFYRLGSQSQWIESTFVTFR